MSWLHSGKASKMGTGPRFRTHRGKAVASLCALALLSGCAGNPPVSNSEQRPAVVFLHGASASEAAWLTTVWRFESNGWPRDRLFVLNVPYPEFRLDDSKPQPASTSAQEHRDYLIGEVDRILKETGTSKVILVANSRGGIAIRDFVRNAGGADKVSYVVMGGTPNHGALTRSDYLPNLEMNGASAYMKALNAPQGPNGEEVTPGVQWMVIRSKDNDKWALPTGEWLGQTKLVTNATHEGVELKGAKNVVIPAIDHRETSFHAKSFEQTWTFLSGNTPKTLDIIPEAVVTLNGKVAKLEGNSVTNLPLVGADFEAYDVSCASGERNGAAIHRRSIGSNGAWGPLTVSSKTCLEFVVKADGYATAHFYRSPFLRSSGIVSMRAVKLKPEQREAGSVVSLFRPRGYLDLRRDKVTLDGKIPPGIPAGVAGVDRSTLLLADGTARTVEAKFNGERIAARNWPARENHISIAEMHY